MPEIDQTAQGVLFGNDLRALRTRIPGLSQVEVAKLVGTSHATVCRLEHGRRLGPETAIRGMLRLYGLSGTEIESWVQRAQQARNPGWLAEHNGTVHHWFRRYLGLEQGAVRKVSYEPELVPGLLQIREYTQAVALAFKFAGPSDSAEHLAEVRAARQQLLLRNETVRPRLQFTAVLNEAVIRRPVGGHAVMRAQLAHLAEMSKENNIRLHILPFSAREHPAMTGGAFTMLELGETPLKTVFLEHPDGATYIDRPDDVRRYETTFAQLIDLAMSEAETITVIRKAEQEMRG